MKWTSFGRNAFDYLGIIPQMLNEYDPRPAREQLNDGYAHGGGWRPFKGFTMDEETLAIKYPGDPPYKRVASVKLREETIIVYPHAWVAIVQPDGTFEVCRMD